MRNGERPGLTGLSCGFFLAWSYGLLYGVVYELQVDGFGAVAEARTELQDAGVARVPIVEVRSDVLEELSHDDLVLKNRGRLAPRVEVVLFGDGNEPVHQTPDLFGLRLRSLYAAVLNDLSGHRGEHRPAVGGVTSELAAPLRVPHKPSLSSW